MADHPTDDGQGKNRALFNDLPASDRPFDGRIASIGIILFGLIALLVALDLISDARGGIRPWHLLLEGSVLASSLAGVAALGRSLVRARRDVSDLSKELATWRAEATVWRGEAHGLLEGLGVAIDRQFGRWSLSQAERDVGLLLIKGFSLKEIAVLRTTSERTVRQQAQAIYRKAGVGGRAELSAFFLEDLLLPGAVGQLDRPSPPRAAVEPISVSDRPRTLR